MGHLKLLGFQVPHPTPGGAPEPERVCGDSGTAGVQQAAGITSAGIQSSGQAGARGGSPVYTGTPAPTGRDALPRNLHRPSRRGQVSVQSLAKWLWLQSPGPPPSPQCWGLHLSPTPTPQPGETGSGVGSQDAGHPRRSGAHPDLPRGVPARGRPGPSDHVAGSCGTVLGGAQARGGAERGAPGARMALGKGRDRPASPAQSGEATAASLWGARSLPLPVSERAGLSGRGWPLVVKGFSSKAIRRLLAAGAPGDAPRHGRGRSEAPAAAPPGPGRAAGGAGAEAPRAGAQPRGAASARWGFGPRGTEEGNLEKSLQLGMGPRRKEALLAPARPDRGPAGGEAQKVPGARCSSWARSPRSPEPRPCLPPGGTWISLKGSPRPEAGGRTVFSWIPPLTVSSLSNRAVCPSIKPGIQFTCAGYHTGWRQREKASQLT
jgi:hypothetical protein